MPENEERSGSILIRLTCASCRNSIPVCVRAEGDDAVAIQAALAENEDRALLTRFCPFCMERREFILPLNQDRSGMDSPLKSQVSFHESRPVMEIEPAIGTPDLRETPKARAVRLYREGAALARKGESAAAERALRESADLFERARLFREGSEAVLELTKLISQDPSRKEEAEEILAAARKRGMVWD